MVMMRAPLAPNGWPIAMAPPLTLVLARSALVSAAQANVGLRGAELFLAAGANCVHIIPLNVVVDGVVSRYFL